MSEGSLFALFIAGRGKQQSYRRESPWPTFPSKGSSFLDHQTERTREGTKVRENVAEHERKRLHHLHAWFSSIRSAGTAGPEGWDAAEHPFLLQGIIFSPPSVSLQHCTLIHSERNTRLKNPPKV